MCNCRGIQNEWIAPPNEWDIAIQKNSGEQNTAGERIDPSEMNYFIWLPRQDQIQEMILECYKKQFKIASCFLVNNMFNFWLHSDLSDRKRQFKVETLEQLWLVFYMNEKHGLTWNKDKWIKEK